MEFSREYPSPPDFHEGILNRAFPTKGLGNVNITEHHEFLF